MSLNSNVIHLELHHIGIVVDDIAVQRAMYVETLGYVERTPIIHDPVQTAFVQFLRLHGADHYIELVAPDSDASMLYKASRKGQPFNHLCYSIHDIRAALDIFRAKDVSILQEPTPAIAFDMREIAWLVTAEGLKIELVEKGAEGSL